MNRTPERVERLAAEYVLGTLTGGARRRFERWMMESWAIRQEVWFWEHKLGELATRVPPVAPPASVWARIEQRLWPQEATPQKSGGGLSWLWAGWSLMATAAVMVMAVLLIQQPEPSQGPLLSGAVVQKDITDPLWLVAESGDPGQLRLKPVAATPAEGNQDYELWVVPEGDGNPMSLGVIPVGKDMLQIRLSPETRAALSVSRTLAISLEPKGGSPTGAPTGPILHITKLHPLE
ncbi:anti-sigma factor [Marinobacter sp. 1Y8]